MTAVILLAGAVLVLCLALFEFSSLWKVLHDVVRGLFGISAFVVPVLMAVVAIAASQEQTRGTMHARLWQSALLLIAFSSALEIFLRDVGENNYFQAIGASYLSGIPLRSGGALGALLGYPMEYAFTDTGAKIIVVLLVFVFAMLLTGTTVASLVRAIGKPVKKTKESIELAIRDHADRRVGGSKDIDIDMGEGYPEEPPEDAVDKAIAQIVKNEPEEAPSDKLEAFEKAARELKEEDGKRLYADDLPPSAPPPAEEDPDGGVSAQLDAALKDGGREGGKPEPPSYRYPPISLLDEPKPVNDTMAAKELHTNAELLVKTLREFGVETRVVDISRGPSVTRYELEPSAGVKISRITGLADDIALRLATSGVRIEAPIPNKAAVGIEVPNRVCATVCLRELIDSNEFATAKSKLTVALGRDITGKIVLADLAKMPHLLIAGTTGSGKSVCTNSMIQSVLYRASPDDVRLLLIDPKQVEFGIYNGIPHLLVPVVTDPRKAAGALGWAVTEMLRRYQVFAANNVRDLESYNEAAKRSDTLQPMPQILIVIDELADLMMAAANEVEDAIIRLAQMARAAGMHLVIATQRPSVDVITGLIKANIPSRLALTVASSVDSRTILDTGGAEKLLGRGDMLFMPIGVSKPMRVQGCFVSNKEVEAVVQFLKSSEESAYDESIIEEIDRQAAQSGKSAGKSGGDPEDDGEGDEMLPQAIEVVVEAGMASTSLLQRKLRLGYARAGRLIDELEQRGIIGPHEGSKPRQVLITRQQWLERNMMHDDE